MKYTLPVTAALLMLGCSSPKDVNESNFKAAINEYYSKKPACISAGKLPIQYADSLKRDYKIKLDEFVKLGLLDAKEGQIEILSFKAKMDMEPATTYSLNDKGREFATLDNGPVAFCYGNYQVEELTSFNNVEREDKEIFEAAYTYKIPSVADWAKSSELLQSMNKDLKRDIAGEPIDSKALLGLTDNGWKVESIFK